MPIPQPRNRTTQAVHKLGTQLLDLAVLSWHQLKEHPAITQEVAKDPFTNEVKAQSATAELVIFLVHACDRVSTSTFDTTFPEEVAKILRNAFMGGLVGVTLPAFVQQACPNDDAEEREELQADLLHLYNARATQYGFFSLGSTDAPENDALFKLAGIRLAEALDCPENAAVITHAIDVVVSSLIALRKRLPLKETIGELLAGAR